jgi:hypothetical protein
MRSILFFCLLLSACSGDVSVPDDVLPPKKMEAVLHDVIKADEMVTLLQFSDSTYNNFSKRTALYDTVFNLHGVKKVSFQKSLKFYQGRPDLLNEMTNRIHEKLMDTSKTKKPLSIQ